ncbi:MAG: hypothetical protein HY901_27970 [Deltaproteobacteria bacterium]|nr:hypothetical protein [Deltaproteobacteria bacterium]
MTRFLLPALLVLFAPVTSHAARPQVRLSYERGSGAERCPGEQSIRDGVLVRLGYQPFAAEGELAIAARVAGEDDSGLVARITMRDASGELLGEREVVSPHADCTELTEAMVLAICIAIDPVGVGWVERKPVVATAEPRDEPSTASAVPPSFNATLGVVGSLGVEPGVSLGAALGGSVRWSLLSLGLEARASFPVAAREVAEGKVTGAVSAGSVLSCLHRGPLAGCVFASGGALRVSSEGIAGGRSVTGAFFAAGGRALYELGLTQALGLRFNLDLIVPFVPSSIVVDRSAAWVSPPVAGSAGLALSWKL